MVGGCESGLKVEKDCKFTLVAPFAGLCLLHSGASWKGQEARGNSAHTAAQRWTVPPMLLTDNDWSRLSRALREMREDKLSVKLEDTTVEAWTTNVKRGWPVAMLVGLRVEAGHMVQRQYFESVEAARRAAERWKI